MRSTEKYFYILIFTVTSLIWNLNCYYCDSLPTSDRNFHQSHQKFLLYSNPSIKRHDREILAAATPEPTILAFPNFSSSWVGDEDDQNSTWWIAEVVRGRLGNNMFQYASNYGIYRAYHRGDASAILNNNPITTTEGERNISNHTTSIFPERFCVSMQKRNRYKNLTKFYQGPMAPVCSKTIVPTIELEEIGYGIYTNLSSFSLCPNNNHALSVGGGVGKKCAIVLREYLMSYRYFHHVQAEIRHMFDLRRGLRQHQRDSFLLHLRSPVIMKQQQQNEEKIEVILVGIHIRKTDMARDSAFRDPPIRYYQDAMNYFRSKYETRHQIITFVLASDNIAWCQRQKIFQNVTVIPTNLDAFVSMAILRYCDHMILSLGTFGWWAAYLGGGDAVYWNHAFDMNHSKHQGKIALEDYYLPHWIGLE